MAYSLHRDFLDLLKCSIIRLYDGKYEVYMCVPGSSDDLSDIRIPAGLFANLLLRGSAFIREHWV
jgi:hypothetical protein